MSFAGPILRRTRMHDADSMVTEPSRRGQLATSSNHSGMRSSRPSGATILLAGIAIGAIVGATTALLFAPQSGEDTRRVLGRQSKRLAKRGREAWDDLGDEFRRQRNAVRRRFASAL
jgi:hypothetical protein